MESLQKESQMPQSHTILLIDCRQVQRLRLLLARGVYDFVLLADSAMALCLLPTCTATAPTTGALQHMLAISLITPYTRSLPTQGQLSSYLLPSFASLETSGESIFTKLQKCCRMDAQLSSRCTQFSVPCNVKI